MQSARGVLYCSEWPVWLYRTLTHIIS